MIHARVSILAALNRGDSALGANRCREVQDRVHEVGERTNDAVGDGYTAWTQRIDTNILK